MREESRREGRGGEGRGVESAASIGAGSNVVVIQALFVVRGS